MQMNDGNNDPNRLFALFLTSPENKGKQDKIIQRDLFETQG